MKESQNAESTRWLVVYAGRKMYQKRNPAAAGCRTRPYGKVSLISFCSGNLCCLYLYLEVPNTWSGSAHRRPEDFEGCCIVRYKLDERVLHTDYQEGREQ